MGIPDIISTPRRDPATILCILDGWGIATPARDNAISCADTPTWDRWLKEWPRGKLDASGEAVGLPPGQMGNSEVGHLTIGSGRIVRQALPRINQMILEQSLHLQPAIKTLIDQSSGCSGTCHVIGLLSDGGVHGHIDHLLELVSLLASSKTRVAIHGILDGRDAAPTIGAEHLARTLEFIRPWPGVELATVCGRFFAMDRDNRWERTQAFGEAVFNARGEQSKNILASTREGVERAGGDEFLSPIVSSHYHGTENDDSIAVLNFRPDRVQQMLTYLLDPTFDAIPRLRINTFHMKVGMVPYGGKLNSLMNSALMPEVIDDTLGATLARANKKQLRLAESEKFPHVTYFFNGGDNELFEGESHLLVPSPRVLTYDLKPEMSAEAVTDHLCENISNGKWDFIAVNFANGDMVGHSGNFQAAVAAVEAIDRCLARIDNAIHSSQAVALITADHGNCELMSDPVTGSPHTAHTCNQVPVILINSPTSDTHLSAGTLADIAPSILTLMNIPVPSAMTGRALFRLPTRSNTS